MGDEDTGPGQPASAGLAVKMMAAFCCWLWSRLSEWSCKSTAGLHNDTGVVRSMILVVVVMIISVELYQLSPVIQLFVFRSLATSRVFVFVFLVWQLVDLDFSQIREPWELLIVDNVVCLQCSVTYTIRLKLYP